MILPVLQNEACYNRKPFIHEHYDLIKHVFITEVKHLRIEFFTTD